MPGALCVRVQMPQPVEAGRDDEEVHQVAVIGDEVVEAAAANPARIVERQREAAVGHRGRRLERLVDIPGVVRRFRAPPPVAGDDRHHDDRAGNRTGDATAAAGPWPGRFSWRQTRFARRRGDDGDQAGAEEDHQAGEQHAQRPAHRQGRLGKRGHRHSQLARAVIARDRDADLPGSRGHHPEVSGEEARVC